jgi:predicted secreted hydrolase
MAKKIKLPEDEMPHKDQAIEWWYFNGFLEGEKKYAFMTCLFKADGRRVNLPFLKIPVKDWYFSHTVLFDLSEKKVIKEVLPVVLISDDSFKRSELFVEYFLPLRTKFVNYEIARQKDKLRLKTGFFDLILKEKKKPLLEGGSGFIKLPGKSTYYYSYPNLEAGGFVGNERVKGKAWHDKQWSEEGFMNDPWLWFSIQLPNNTEIVCFNYKGKKMATISYPDNKQETKKVEFIPVGKEWKSRRGIKYNLRWKIKIDGFDIETEPIMEDCEINFGIINYWEGPLQVKVNGKKAFGFMELVEDSGNKNKFIAKIDILNFLKKKEVEIIKKLKNK